MENPKYSVSPRAKNLSPPCPNEKPLTMFKQKSTSVLMTQAKLNLQKKNTDPSGLLQRKDKEKAKKPVDKEKEKKTTEKEKKPMEKEKEMLQARLISSKALNRQLSQTILELEK